MHPVHRMSDRPRQDHETTALSTLYKCDLCGTGYQGSSTGGVCVWSWAGMHESIDLKGEFLCDFRLDSADGQTLALTYMLTGDKSGFHPVTQAIIAADEADGLDREQIIERRAGIMTSEFIGFTPAHVFMVRPDLALSDEIEVDGQVFKGHTAPIAARKITVFPGVASAGQIQEAL